MQFLRMDVESVEYLCQFPEIDYEIYSSPEIRLAYLLLLRDTLSEKNDLCILVQFFQKPAGCDHRRNRRRHMLEHLWIPFFCKVEPYRAATAGQEEIFFFLN